MQEQQSDITLGEVYRAVLSLKDDFAETRKEVKVTNDRVAAQLVNLSLDLKEVAVRQQALENIPNEVGELKIRVGKLEDSKTRAMDPWARIGSLISAIAAGLIAWWTTRG